MKKALAPLVLLTPRLTLAAAEASSSVSSGITSAVPYLVGIGMSLSAVGLIRAGIKYNSGDPQAKEDAKSTLIGSVLILTASAIVGLLKTWFA